MTTSEVHIACGHWHGNWGREEVHPFILFAVDVKEEYRDKEDSTF